jgi:RNA polymerase sigma-70 factor (ECF subfamily)
MQLIRRAQSGDEAAFAELIEACYDQMYGCALKYAGNKPDAEDITQQACIKLARSLHQFRFEAAFSTWVFRLVINCAKDWFRGSERHEQAPAATPGTSPEGSTETVIETTSDSSGLIYLAQILDQVADFGEGFREAVVLVLGEGLSHRDAAEILGVKESTVSWRIHETRKRLAQQEAAS